MSRRHTLQTATRRPALGPVLLLVAALLWAQLLGLAHGVLHAQAGGHAHTAARPSVASPAPGLLAHLLAPQPDEADCRVYDQLGQASPVPALPTVAPAVPLPLWFSWALQVRRLPSPCAFFAARAPPASR